MAKRDAIPEDTAALQAAVAELGDQLAERDALITSKEEALAAVQQENARLRHVIEVLQKQAFGPRSEKRQPVEPDEHARQGALLFPELMVAAQRLADELVQDRAWVLAQLRGKDAAAQ